MRKKSMIETEKKKDREGESEIKRKTQKLGARKENPFRRNKHRAEG